MTTVPKTINIPADIYTAALAEATRRGIDITAVIAGFVAMLAGDDGETLATVLERMAE